MPERPRFARLCLVAALLVFGGLGLWQSRTFMVWSEEMIVDPMPAAEVLAPEPDAAGVPRVEPSCLEPGAPLIIHSASRPTLNLCAGGRAFPIMIAPYFAGWFYWPFALLAPLHHDNMFALRALGMVLGLVSIVVTFAAVRRLAGPGAAALTALATAVMPCFLLVHATLEHFETLPWIWMMGAILFFLGCPGLAPGAQEQPGDLPTRRLVLGALFLGLAVAANAKSLILLSALGALALRLGVPVRRVRAGQWVRMGLAGVAPLLPMFALALLPANGYGDKSSGALQTLVAHLTDPRWVLSSGRGLILLWADVAYYFGDFLDAPPLHTGAVALALAAFAFVLADTARTLARRRGCPVTAGAGVCLVAYLIMVALLYDSFPSNFTPLHTVFAVSLALAAHRLGGALAARARSPWPAVAVGALALAPFAWSAAGMIGAMADIRVHTNADAERALAGYLADRKDDRVPVVTADLIGAGVLDSLSGGAVRTLRAHEFFTVCRPLARNPGAPACVADRWRKLLPFVVKGSAWFVAPTDWSRWGSAHLSYVPGLTQVAAELGYRVTLEKRFPTRRGLDALDLYRIDAPAP
jgi:hypothetical protein